MPVGRVTCPLLRAAAPGGGLAVCGIYHHRGLCSRQSTLRLPPPCGLSSGAPLLGETPPGAICWERWVDDPFESVFIRTPPLFLGALNSKNIPPESNDLLFGTVRKKGVCR